MSYAHSVTELHILRLGIEWEVFESLQINSITVSVVIECQKVLLLKIKSNHFWLLIISESVM